MKHRPRISLRVLAHLLFFFFNDTATTEIYTLSLHDALPILGGGDDVIAIIHMRQDAPAADAVENHSAGECRLVELGADRKSTRLNSSHLVISYAVFCLKKKNLLRHY